MTLHQFARRLVGALSLVRPQSPCPCEPSPSDQGRGVASDATLGAVEPGFAFAQGPAAEAEGMAIVNDEVAEIGLQPDRRPALFGRSILGQELALAALSPLR